jgi:hypothetical protein
MNIQINEPCHENWQEMTPNQQGAFCKVCNKDVVDFSKKSITEIKSFFTKEAEGKICGRFEKQQIAYLSFDDFFASFKYWVLSKKLAVIFFFNFGFMAFTSCAQGGTHMTGKVVAPQQTHLQGAPVARPNEMTTGDVVYIPADTIKKQTKPVIKGEVNVPTYRKKKQQQL